MQLALFDDFIPGRVEAGAVVDLSAAVGPRIMAMQPRARMNAIIEAFEALRPALETADGPRRALGAVRLRALRPLTSP